MARGPKTRFAEMALQSGLDSAVRAFPNAFNAEELAQLRTLEELPLKQKLEELFKHWDEFEHAMDD